MAATARQQQIEYALDIRHRQIEAMRSLRRHLPRALVAAQKSAAPSPSQWRDQAVSLSSIVTQLEKRGVHVLAAGVDASYIDGVLVGIDGVKRMGSLYAWVVEPPVD